MVNAAWTQFKRHGQDYRKKDYYRTFKQKCVDNEMDIR